MKLIHTADWHLGNSMHDIDRLEESKLFLNWLKERIEEFGAECLVVAGDIFDVVNPSNVAKSQYYRFLASLLNTRCKNVVVEESRAELGIDIGQTLIGMHLKRVAVPVRLSRKMLGKAVITAAYTRPPLIGGARAQYPDKKLR